ncbi:MAG TPA: hypothetical protein VM943_11025 [Pyrinomonadaceae bacterium]|nr:hypothetical protein [Pyrinomonadaceae bacterium]
MTKRPADSTEITGVRVTESPAATFESARKQDRGGGGAGSDACGWSPSLTSNL